MVSIAHSWDSVITRLLITHEDIQVNIRDKDGISAFMRECGCGTDDLVETLMASFPGLEVGGRSNGGRSALMQACEGGKVQIIKLLLDRDPTSVNDTDDMGWTPLICIVDRFRPPNRLSTLHLLLEHGADLHAVPTGIFSISPSLLTASWAWAKQDWKEEAERASLLSLFLTFDLDCIHHRDGNGQTALMLAVREGAGPLTLDLLLSHPGSGAKGINARDHKGLTALFHALQLFSKVNWE
ncbi:ankyrin [Coprinellus micaceus]|uniref:Ankyrin n=1 Tax=Coprinellus micaceus TaxID=71717 RepID=A0A4Y7SZR4_COPMI|nr:ankyrin [Coprinellus micaceus]